MSNRRKWASKLNLAPAHNRRTAAKLPQSTLTAEEYKAIRAAQEAARLARNASLTQKGDTK